MPSRDQRLALSTLLFVLVFVFEISATASGVGIRMLAIGRRSGAQIASSVLDKKDTSLIVSGVGVGELKLGDSQARAFKLFHQKDDVDQYWKSECGSVFNWVDTSNSSKGNIFVLFRNGHVVQIGSSTTRYHTPEALTTYDSPDLVQRYYKGLRAYELLGSSNAALGNRPLIFWVDQAKGIAFEFAYFPEERRRYLYEIIVFKPGGDLCPEGRTTGSTNWRELPPYSLEPPDATAELSCHRRHSSPRRIGG